MTSLPTVLILTYPEHGQANVNLAISYELALAGYLIIEESCSQAQMSTTTRTHRCLPTSSASRPSRAASFPHLLL
ncbi:hypothetical protein JVT61DRAFT_10282 [Boletus reticuloceps]|uniref:Uncharacterized protein n=1 Tax=Boletus reticuloceps TaxID=495285 RepID=A0A8I2Z024_9AGAM|nr:hypothetical protein JVT61DRAFT_10282 [Boletus reticuloceps]